MKLPPRVKLLAIFGLFLLPLVSAYLIYYYTDWRPEARSNNGQLVSPALPLNAARLYTVGGEARDQSQFQGHWTLLMVGPSDCGEACQQRLYITRQLHTALGRRANRVQRVYVATEREQIVELQRFVGQNHPGLKLLVDPQGQGPDLPHFFAEEAENVAEGLKIYLLDPLGNWLMYYESGATPKDIHQDLKRLLRLSRIG